MRPFDSFWYLGLHLIYMYIYIYRFCDVKALGYNPTSPLGLGGLAWGVCFQPLFFQPFWFQPSGEGFTPPPTPALKTPPLPWIRLRTKFIETLIILL